ncbi:MAG: hypothetical protein HOV94_18495 [Saccharothrix sp.]|nr:hypothetical protein [Saccharothrix sp.]
MRRSAALLIATAATAAVVTGAAPATAEPASADKGDRIARAELSLDKLDARRHGAGSRTASPSAAAEAEAEPYDGTRFIPTAPRRVLDTRSGLGRNGVVGPVGQFSKIEVPLDGLPSFTVAVVLNVTGTSPTAATYVTVWEGGDLPKPGVSTLNLVPGETRANSVTTWVSLENTVNLYNNAGTTHLIADIAGYYVYDNPGTGATPARYFATGPSRAYDSRNTGGAFGQAETRSVDFSAYGVPAGASAVSLNITGVDATAATYVTAWPSGNTRPTASSLNVVPGGPTPNGVTVAIGSDRKVNLYNNVGSLHLVVDITGYYLASDASGQDFYPLGTPSRAFDTREDSLPIGPAETLSLLYLDPDLAPGHSLLLNLTGTDPSASTHLTPFPAGENRPNTSALNLVPGQTSPNMATVRLGSAYDDYDQKYYPAHGFYNNAGWTDLVVDVFGVFA